MAAARRHSTARRLSGWRPEEVENFFDENDDDAEKKRAAQQKREEAERKAQHARSPFRETPGHQARTAIITDMYSECIQLCAENKVNEKNSWSLDLIDHMGRMIGEPASAGDGSVTNFQLASSTLDAGVKIYAYRVDSVYTETFKLMGGLNRTTKKEAADDADANPDADDADADDAATVATQKKEKRRTAATAHSTLESNVASLNMKKLEVAFEVDPLFHRTSAKFDEGGAKGLLLHNLPVSNGCELIFDSTSVRRKEALPTSPPIPYEQLAPLLPTNFASLRVCDELAALAKAVRPPDDLSDGWGDGDGDADSDSGDAVFDAGADYSDTDADAPAWPDADCGTDPAMCDEGGAAADADEVLEAREAAFERQVHRLQQEEGAASFMSVDELLDGNGEGEAQMVEASPAEALQLQAQRLLGVGHRWAGPSHWKFRSADSASAEASRRGGSKAAKAPFVIDFGRREEVAAQVLATPLDPKGATLSSATLAKANASSITLPRDCQCSVDVLTQLFNKPRMRVRRHVRRAVVRKQAIQVTDTVAAPPLESTEDAFSCDGDDLPAAVDDDWDDEAVPTGEAAGVESVSADPGALDLVAAPAKVQKIDIGYAKSAKQVDIKGLKQALWELLNEAFMQAGGSETISFAAVVGRLPSKLAAHKLPDISCAYCFICLLHLANEKGLEIAGEPQMSDLRVTPPPS